MVVREGSAEENDSVLEGAVEVSPSARTNSRSAGDLGLVVDNKIEGSNHVVIIDDKFVVLKTTARNASNLPKFGQLLGSPQVFKVGLTESYPVGGPVRVLSACVSFAAFPASTRVSSIALYFSVVRVSDSRLGRP